jgi:hypothetical protein
MSPLVSVTDYFMGLELRPEQRAQERRRAAIVARALARQRKRPATKRARSAPATPAGPRWELPARRSGKAKGLLPMPPEHVEVRSKSASPVTIALSARSWRTLRDLARESTDGRETAGFLFADHVWGWNRQVAVRFVTRSVKERSERSALLDIGELVAEKAALRNEGVADRVGEVGSWHTHPISEDGHPSDADLAHWLNSRDFLDRAFYIGLILTADGSDARWSRPTVHAWITRRAGTLKRPVCEPALVSTNEGRSS